MVTEEGSGRGDSMACRHMYGGCPQAKYLRRSKLLLTASSVHVCTHTPPHLPKDLKVMLSSLQDIFLPFLCLFSKAPFILGTPCSPDCASGERHPLLPPTAPCEHEVPCGFPVPLPSLQDLPLLGMGGEGTHHLGGPCGTSPCPTPPHTAERSWGVLQPGIYFSVLCRWRVGIGCLSFGICGCHSVTPPGCLTRTDHYTTTQGACGAAGCTHQERGVLPVWAAFTPK